MSDVLIQGLLSSFLRSCMICTMLSAIAYSHIINRISVDSLVIMFDLFCGNVRCLIVEALLEGGSGSVRARGRGFGWKCAASCRRRFR